MPTLGAWLVLAAAGTSLPLLCTADTQSGFELGKLFDIVDFRAPSPFEQLGKRGCLPADFSVGAETVAAIKGCSGLVEVLNYLPSTERWVFRANCTTERLNMTDGGKFVPSVFTSLVKGFSQDLAWTERANTLAVRCLNTSNPKHSGLQPRQQAVSVLMCWSWGLKLDCDLAEMAKTGQRTAEASCRRGRFLGGACRLSPGTLLQPLAENSSRGVLYQGLNSNWQLCLQETRASWGGLLAVLLDAQAAVSDDQCRLLDAAMTRLVGCLMEEFVQDSPVQESSGDDDDDDGADSVVDLDDLRRAAMQRSSDSHGTRALLEVIKHCSDATALQAFIDCWTQLAIHSCAVDEANQVARQV